MAVDFSKFDQTINKEQLRKDMEAASNQEFDEVPKGTYIISIDRMEVKPTKAGDKLMFAVQANIKETVSAPKKQDKRKIFFNRVICGNRVTEKWNDGAAIKGVITWIEDLTGEKLEFVSYSQLSEDVVSVVQDFADVMEAKVEYDPEAFNPISIKEVFDVD